MSWRRTQAEARDRAIAPFDPAAAERWAASLTPEAVTAYRADLAGVFDFRDGMRVLDAGAGAGFLCRVLLQAADLRLTALEPAPAMAARLRQTPELTAIEVVEGFCDAESDRRHFEASTFDVIASRQLANGLFDPLAAFRNWHHWLKPGGAVVLIEGLFDRAAWTGDWEQEVDVLPLSVAQTTALVPYLLESVGFAIAQVAGMEATNALPASRARRYAVVAVKPAGTSDADAPVSSLKNLGPSSERWLRELGILTVGDLVAYDPVEAYKAMPQGVSLNMLYAMVGGLMGLHWTQLPPELKADLRARVQPG